MLRTKQLDFGHAGIALEDGHDAAVRESQLARLLELCPALRAGETLYGLSVHQPWASLIAEGRKTIEVRCWRTRHRGPLLICASKRPRRGLLPTGVAVALVEITDSRELAEEDSARSLVDWGPSLWAWEMRLIAPLDHFPIQGGQRLFRVAAGSPGERLDSAGR